MFLYVLSRNFFVNPVPLDIKDVNTPRSLLNFINSGKFSTKVGSPPAKFSFSHPLSINSFISSNCSISDNS